MNERIKQLILKAGFHPFVRGEQILFDISTEENLKEFAELIIEEAAKAHLCDSDGVVGKYSDSDRYYFETLMKKQLGLK